jgi:hypothetical protein
MASLRKRILKGALKDPEVIKAIDGLIATMKERGVLPTRLNVIHHVLHEGGSEEKAVLFGMLLEHRLKNTSPAD